MKRAPQDRPQGSTPRPEGLRGAHWDLSRMPTNYELFNGNNVKVRHLSWNYRGCWHQTGPQVDTRCIPWVFTHSPSTDPETDRGATSRRCFTSAHR